MRERERERARERERVGRREDETETVRQIEKERGKKNRSMPKGALQTHGKGRANVNRNMSPDSMSTSRNMTHPLRECVCV